MRTRTLIPNQTGIGLVELMVAMVIGLILIAGVTQIFVGTRKSYEISDGLSRLQENGRFAMDFLAHDLRMAGQTGCTPSNFNNFVNSGSVLFDLNTPISGLEYTGTGPGNNYTIASLDPATANSGDWSDTNGNHLSDVLPDLVGNVVPGTDIVMTRGARGLNGVRIDSGTPVSGTAINTNKKTGVAKGRVVMVSDCQSADIFQNVDTDSDTALDRDTSCGGVSPCNIAAGTPWSQSWNDNAELFTLSSKVYFIGASDLDGDGNPDPDTAGLWEADYSSGGVVLHELVQGVENMQVLYGIDTTADANREADKYVTADGVTDWRDVVSVQISLLMRTTDELPQPEDKHVYAMQWDDSNVADADAVRIEPKVGGSNDTRTRKVFATTVALRNRIIRN